MQRSFVLARRNAKLTVILPFALLFAAACGMETSGGSVGRAGSTYGGNDSGVGPAIEGGVSGSGNDSAVGPAVEGGVSGSGNDSGVGPACGNDSGVGPGVGNDSGVEPGAGNDSGVEPGVGNDAGIEPGVGNDAGIEPGVGNDSGIGSGGGNDAGPASTDDGGVGDGGKDAGVEPSCGHCRVGCKRHHKGHHKGHDKCCDDDRDAGVAPAGDAGVAPAGDAGVAPADDAGAADGAPNPPNPSGMGPAPIDLGASSDLTAAGSYVLLAKTGITNVTGSSISGGNVGLSPAAASFISGFALTADAINVSSTSPSVVLPGRVYAADYAPPTPSNVGTAILDMEAAYTDAAGRTNPDFVDLGGGSIGGLTLVPGLYKWTTGVTIATNVVLAGGANDVFIFQIAKDLDVSVAQGVLLSGGANAANIFWQVGGQATIHANAHFEGVILSQTGITLQTGASLNGRALAQSLIAIDDNAVTAP